MDPMKRILDFTRMVEYHQRMDYAKRFSPADSELMDRDCRVSLAKRTKYLLVDVGTSGKYMIPLEGQPDAGAIYGIKAYGVIHRGHQYGTLETTHEWWWGGYVATRKQYASEEEQEAFWAKAKEALATHRPDVRIVDLVDL